MAVEAVEFSGMHIPSEGGAVSSAISDLEAKLRAWASAAADVQQKLATHTVQVAERDAVQGSPNAAREVATSEDAVPDATLAVDELAGEDTALLDSLEEDMARIVQMRYRMLEGRRSIQDLVNDEEQAWLNSLDPELAKAIRVHRRLFKKRQNMRELIAIYEAENEARNGKKTWWKRMTA